MSLADIRGFAFDLDGCIWAGSTLLPGAADLVRTWRVPALLLPDQHWTVLRKVAS